MQITLRDDVASIVDGYINSFQWSFTPLARVLLISALQAQLDERRGSWRLTNEATIINFAVTRVASEFAQDPELRFESSTRGAVRFNAVLHALVRLGASVFPSGPND